MVGSKSKKNQERLDGQIIQTVDTYLARMENVVSNHERLNRKAEKAIQQTEKKKSKNASSDTDFGQFITEREELKNKFVRFKQSCKEDVERISDQEKKGEKRTSLKSLQDRYRAAREDFKTLGVEDYVKESDREQLLKGASNVENPIHGTRTNDQMLNQANTTAKDTTSKLKEGLSDVQQSQETANQVALTLQEDREKIENITRNVDEIESDLEISKRLVMRFLKKLYTDKIIIALTGLIACAVVAIVIYMIVEGDGSELKPGNS